MIEIRIKADKNQVVDKFEKKQATIGEVSLALLRLKQIEKILIDIQYDNSLEVNEE